MGYKALESLGFTVLIVHNSLNSLYDGNSCVLTIQTGGLALEQYHALCLGGS